MFDQFDNFLFTIEEFNKASDYKELPIKCKECGGVFYKRKKVINNILTSNKRIQYLQYCSEHVDCARYVTVTCAWCGKQHQRLKTEVDKQIRDRAKRNNSTNQFFCDKECARNYIKHNNVKRIRKHSVKREESETIDNVVKQPVPIIAVNKNFKQYLEDSFDSVICLEPNVYHINNLYIAFHNIDEDIKFKADNIVHVYDWEWNNKQQKIINLINTRLNKFDKRLYARQCTVRDIDHKTYKSFILEHHLHSKAPNCELRKGLYYKDELVSVISFNKGRFNPDEYELIRYCVKSGCQIVGGFSKLIKNSGVKQFVSYVDLAHFNGNGYIASGFKILDKTQPNYVYYKDGTVLSRYQAQKHKLQKLLGSAFDNALSETQNMVNAGYIKIKDCGNLKVGYGF